MRIPLEVAPGLYSDDTSGKASGRWRDGSNVRFYLGSPEVIGGWESLIGDLLSGVCRNAFPWTDNANTLDVAFGTEVGVELYQGGALYDITPVGYPVGQIDGTGSTGYGTGAYGVGGYGSPSTTDYFPRTTAFAAWGENLLISPRGGTVYVWQNNTAVKATEIVNAPDEITHMLVAPMDGGYMVFALGCNEEVSGTFNPLCIRHSDVRDYDGWTTGAATTSREYILTGGGRIVAGRMMGSYLLVWTSHSLWLGQFLGDLEQPWKFDRIGTNCGLIGPNAAHVVGRRAFWIGPDLQFYSYSLGGEPEPLGCPIKEEFTENLAASQGDKIIASGNSAFNEVRWDYPDARDEPLGIENSRYLAVCIAGPDAGSWHRGEMARTTMVDAGPSPYPIGVTYEGNIYWHERGHSADGSAMSWFLESADQKLSDETSTLARAFWPDFHHQEGAVTLTLTTRFKPQGEETSKSYVIAPDTDKVDVRCKGRYVKVRFEGSGVPTFAHIGRPVFDVVASGKR